MPTFRPHQIFNILLVPFPSLSFLYDRDSSFQPFLSPYSCLSILQSPPANASTNLTPRIVASCQPDRYTDRLKFNRPVELPEWNTRAVTNDETSAIFPVN